MDYRLLAGLMQFKDLELSAILFNEGKLSSEIRKLGIPVFVANETRLNVFRLVQKVRETILHVSPDIIHSHRLKENLLAYLGRCSGDGIRLVCTEHGLQEPAEKRIKRIKQFLLSKYHHHVVKRHFRSVIAVSADIGHILFEEYGFPKEKIVVINNGTDGRPSDDGKKIRDSFIIGSAGRLFPVKEYGMLVDIAREVLKETDKVVFELAGDGPEMDRISALVERYQIDGAFLLKGFVEDMETFYAGLDLYINTSRHEGFPMSVLEAMAHGLPVIGPNLGGLKDIVSNGLNGYLIDGRDPRSFAGKILELVRDKELVEKMGRESREKIRKEFSIGKMAKNYYDLYSDLCSHQ